MTERDDRPTDPAVQRAKGKDVDGLKTLPDVHSVSGVEKAGTGDEDDTEPSDDDPDPHLASETYLRHRPVGGPPSRHV